MESAHVVVAVLTLGLLASACASETHGNEAIANLEWPPDQAHLGQSIERGDFESWTIVKAQLPADIRITPPAKTVPLNIARLSGTWSGWYCPRRAIDVKMAVEKVEANEITVYMSFWGYDTASTLPAVTLRPLSENEFVGRFEGPYYNPSSALLFRLRKVDGVDVLDVKRTRLVDAGAYAAGSICNGVLKKISSD